MYQICKYGTDDVSITLLDLTNIAQVNEQLFEGNLDSIKTYLQDAPVEPTFPLKVLRRTTGDKFSICTIKNSDKVYGDCANEGYSERGSITQIMALIKDQFYPTLPIPEKKAAPLDPNHVLKLDHLEAIEVLKALHFMSEGYNSTEIASLISTIIMSIEGKKHYASIRVEDNIVRFIIWLCLCAYQSIALIDADNAKAERYTLLLEKFN